MISFPEKLKSNCDFTTLFLILRELNSDLHHNKTVDPQLINLISDLILDKKHEGQSKAFFLYREMADYLVKSIQSTNNLQDRTLIKEKLLFIIESASGDKLRAVGSGISSLPTDFNTFPEPDFKRYKIRDIDFSDFKIKMEVDGEWFGRSIVFKRKEKYIVAKFFLSDDTPEKLLRELFYLSFLKRGTPFLEEVDTIISFKNLPENAPRKLHRRNLAIVFEVGSDYYDYPNDTNVNEENYRDALKKNVHFTGSLAGKGLFHNALIPLFHNRVQTGRRSDNGLYLWEKGGRLDNWLYSCKYPNISISGLRDLEHIEFTEDGKEVYREIGNHILSFILVTGSFFRWSKMDGRKGNLLSGVFGHVGGRAVDTRELFDREFFKSCLHTIFEVYFKAFTGETLRTDFNMGSLTDELITAMAVDLHMEEIVRISDQKNMSDKEFEKLLTRHGIVENYKKGASDLIIKSGPHLGSFNGKISVPTLPFYLMKISSLCIITRYLKMSENHKILKKQQNL